jgi:hypothetical protein
MSVNAQLGVVADFGSRFALTTRFVFACDLATLVREPFDTRYRREDNRKRNLRAAKTQPFVGICTNHRGLELLECCALV